MPVIRYQCPSCLKFTYHTVTDNCVKFADCFRVRCEVCNFRVMAVMNPIHCISGVCKNEAGNRVDCPFKIRPDIIEI